MVLLLLKPTFCLFNGVCISEVKHSRVWYCNKLFGSCSTLTLGRIVLRQVDTLMVSLGKRRPPILLECWGLEAGPSFGHRHNTSFVQLGLNGRNSHTARSMRSKRFSTGLLDRAFVEVGHLKLAQDYKEANAHSNFC